MTDQTYSLIYERWAIETARTDRRLERQLLDSLEQAWQEGSRADRFAVLDFVYDKHIADRFKFLVETLRSREEPLATHAAALSLSLISSGYNLGQEIVEAFDDFAVTFPHLEIFSRTARRLLGGRPGDEAMNRT